MPEYDGMNEGGLPTVYNNQASNAQAILDLIDSYLNETDWIDETDK